MMNITNNPNQGEGKEMTPTERIRKAEFNQNYSVGDQVEVLRDGSWVRCYVLGIIEAGLRHTVGPDDDIARDVKNVRRLS